ncbi:phospholipase [Nonomuraea sp. NPDC002799]
MVGRPLASVALTLTAVLVPATPAHAVTLEQKLAALLGFTQPTLASAAAWREARADQGSWAEYLFDWSTDQCSGSPDRPLGFDFRTSCRRHDFGYRNYQAVGHFPAHKSHIDDAFLFDLREVCAGYAAVAKLRCDGLAWTYYQAVRRFGTPEVVDDSPQLADVSAHSR